jgi:pilus assembly protein FimV
MRSLARWGALLLLGLPLGSWALGLGEIETDTYLNQPLYAEIPVSATPEEFASLRVSLAPVSEFTAQGLEYPVVLNSLRLRLVENSPGNYAIVVTSSQPVADPFVTMLVQVSHARGTFTREYSVLLDPPLFLSDDVASEPIAAPATRDPAVAGGAIARPQPAPAPAPAPQAVAESPAPAPVSSAGDDYTVQNGDTLWNIAERNRPSGVSTNQVMISIFETNPTAFDNNINRLRRGAILRIPPSSEFSRLSSSEATAEVRRQIDAWQGSAAPEPRLVLIPPSDEAAASGVVAGAGDSAAVAALEAELADRNARLAAAEAELAEARRLLQIEDSELVDVQNLAEETAAAAADAAAADAETAVDEAAAADADTLAEDESAIAEAEAEADPAADEAADEAVAESESPPAAVPGASTQASSEPTVVDRLLGYVTNPLYLGIAGGLILLLGALAFLRRRRDDDEDVTGQWEALEAEIDEEADHAATARIRAAQAADPDMVVVEGHRGGAMAEDPPFGDGGTAEIEALGGGTAAVEAYDSGTAEIDALVLPDDGPAPAGPSSLSDQTLSSQTVINLDQADPIAEADFHMAYGLYDQAADLITKALASDPGNRAYKLKLLEVYFVWGNKEAFLENAQAFKREIGGATSGDWDKVVIMGKQICPDEPLFAGAHSAAGEVDLDLESSGVSAGLDFAFGDEDDDVGLDLDIVDGGDDDLSLDASGARGARVERSDDDMLDIGARTQAGLEAALFGDTDEAGEGTMPGGEIGDLDATMESPTVETEAADDDFAITLESPTVEAEGPDAPTVETPTIETAGPLEADSGDTVEQPRPAAGSGNTADMTAEIELDDLGLDLGDLGDLPDEIGELPDEETGRNFTVSLADDDEDSDLLSATGVTQVLHEPADDDDDDIGHTGTAVLGDDDATMMSPGFDADSTGTSTEVLEHSASRYEPDDRATEDDLDLNLDDFSSALEGGETVEQPIVTGFSSVDLDIGDDDARADDEPTGTEEFSPLDPQTMTEVGTKLDLARAYIDMGDPEGAKSILEEVLSEGDSGQRSEAQALIDALPA